MPTNGTALERLDWSLLRLDGLIGEGLAIKEGLLGLREVLVATPTAHEPIQLSTGLSEADRNVFSMIARHRAVSGLGIQHLQVLCQLESKQVSEAVVNLKLEGLIEGMALTDRGKERLGATLPPALENTADLIKLWLERLPEYEARLLRALFACDRDLTLDGWAKAAGFGSVKKGKPADARFNLIDLGLVSEYRLSRSKVAELSGSLFKSPPSYPAAPAYG